MTPTKFNVFPDPQSALASLADSFIKPGKCSPDEINLIREACNAHPGTDPLEIERRWAMFKQIDPKEILSIGKQFGLQCNGCGPSGWKSSLVPERPFTLLWLVSFHKACDLHDILYGIGGDWVAKLFADMYFRRKMVDACRRTLVITWRLGLRWGENTAEIYFIAVYFKGEKFFNWQKKEWKPCDCD